MDRDESLSEMKKKDTKIGWIYFWSDAFLRCFIKQKDNSVWILTVTICPPENEKSSGLYTQVLAIGKSDSNHEEVIKHYPREINDLMNGLECYFGGTNEIGRMAVASRSPRKAIC